MRTAFVLVALLMSTPVSADLVVRSGGEFQVNTYTPYSQQDPALAMQSDGSFIVVWTSDQEVTSDPQRDRRGIFAQRFAATTARIGTEFKVNEIPCGLHGSPAVAVASDDSFVVAWQLNWGCRSFPEADVWARRFSSDGTAVGTEFVVNDQLEAEQYNPAIAALADDTYVLVWTSYEFADHDEPDLSQDGSDAGVFARLLDVDGQRLGTEFQVNTYTTSAQFAPIVAPQGDGFIVTWSGYGVHGQRFATDGERTGTEFVAVVDGAQQHHMAVDSQQRMTVTWATAITGNDLLIDPDAASILGQRVDDQGAPIGPEFSTSADRTGRQRQPSLAHLPDSSFVVVWQDGGSYYPGPPPQRDGDGKGVFANVFTSDGVPSREDFQVNSYTTEDQEPRQSGSGPSAVAADAEGNFVVTWTSALDQDGSYAGVFAQRYCVYADGAACGDVDCLGTSLTTTDALGLLHAAVGLKECALCVCDANGSGITTATDALMTLNSAVGIATAMSCPSCAPG